MAEIASATAGVGSGVATAMLVGIAPDPQVAISWMILALMGAILGFGISPKTSLRQAIVRGLAGVVSSAVFGALAGEVFSLSRLGTASAIIAISTFLHLVIARVADRVGNIVDAGLGRAGVKVEADK